MHTILSPLVVVVPCQHVEHVIPKTCYILVYHQRIPTQILSHPGFELVALDVYDDVYIVNDHGVELKAKAPPLVGYAMFWI